MTDPAFEHSAQQSQSNIHLLDLLAHLCSNAPDQQATFDWLLRWIAYPLQYPRTKMATAVLMHGPGGSGKTVFWRAIAKLYGPRGVQISQGELDNAFNGWAAGARFVLGEDIASSAEQYQPGGRIETLITEPIRTINRKGMWPSYEANHANFVFLSNRPDIAEIGDNRRYAVIRTPEALGEDFYEQLRVDIDRGGIEALHDYLLRISLDHFFTDTQPPMAALRE